MARKLFTDQELLEILTKSDSEDEYFEEGSDDGWDSDDSLPRSPQPSTSFAVPQTPSSVPRQLFPVSPLKQLFSNSPLVSEDSEESETEEEVPMYRDHLKDVIWRKRPLRPKIHHFNDSDSGNKRNVCADDSILTFFCEFFSKELMSIISSETNKFYVYTLSTSPETPFSRLKSWKNTSVDELYVFLAVCMLMTRNKKLSINEYWSRDWLLKSPAFSEIMSRDRFLILLRMLHFSDNQLSHGGDRLIKIRSIVDSLRRAFGSSIVPFKNLCVDESLLLFKGNLMFKQYIPLKRSRFGVKTFVLCDCETGFVLDFIVYTGATSDIEDVGADLGKTGDIVVTLLRPYLDKGHTIFVDNWYTSPALFLWLYERATNACGTVRKTRKQMPKMEEKLKRGEITFRSSDILLALKWCDKREVWMLSTCHNVKTEEVRRKSGETVFKPSCVVEYNMLMGAVDKSDMVINCIESIRKTVKWYKNFFFHLLDLSVLNAHILHKIVTGKNLPIAKFQLELIRELLGTYWTERKKARRGRRSTEETPLRLTARHFPSVYETESSTKKQPTKRCVVCSKKKIRRETRYLCKVCDVGLCVSPCFEIYHTKQNF